MAIRAPDGANNGATFIIDHLVIRCKTRKGDCSSWRQQFLRLNKPQDQQIPRFRKSLINLLGGVIMRSIVFFWRGGGQFDMRTWFEMTL